MVALAELVSNAPFLQWELLQISFSPKPVDSQWSGDFPSWYTQSSADSKDGHSHHLS